MSEHTPGKIVVGVTGAGRETAALQYAAARARRDGLEVLLVHAYAMDLMPAPPAGVLISADDLSQVAAQIIAEVRAEFVDLVGDDVPLRAVAEPGSAASVLVEESRSAVAVVVQHRHSSLLGRIFVGSTANRVAAHAVVPVISVTQGWSPPESPPASPGEVMVGVHGDGEPRAALEAAFAEADASGAEVRVVHAWRLDPAYDDIINTRVADDWRHDREQELAHIVEGVAAAHPDVEVRLDVRHEWPPQVLAELSESADLMVVGRHAHLSWLPERLGSTARSVIREARCPVMVVPVEHARGHDGRGPAGEDARA